MSSIAKPNFKTDTKFDHGADPNDQQKFRPDSAPRPMPQPGDYHFLVPADFGTAWEEIEGKFQQQPIAGLRWFHGKRKDGKPAGELLRFYGGPYDGDPLKFYSFSTVPRERRGGEFASDALYFFRDGFGLLIPQSCGKGDWWELAQQVAAIPEEQRIFGAFLEYQAQCRADKVRYISGKEDPKGKPGCGERYYQSHFEAARVAAGTKSYPSFIEHSCHDGVKVIVNAMPGLSAFRRAKLDGGK